MAILPHPTTLQPVGIPILDRGHPLGAHMIAGWVMNTNDYPMEIVRQRRATDSFSTGTNYQPGPAGGVINSGDVGGGSGNGITVFALGENLHLDNSGTKPHSIVARGKMLDNTKADSGWIFYNHTWGFGQITDNLRYRVVDVGDYASGSVFVNGRIYTMGASNNISNVYLYINGVLKASPATGTPATLPNGNWEIGDFTGTGQRWQGTIEYVYVFDKMLTANEHMWIHQNPYGMFMQPALSRWFEFISPDAAPLLTIGTTLAKVSAAINIEKQYVTNSPRLNAYFEHFWGGRS